MKQFIKDLSPEEVIDRLRGGEILNSAETGTIEFYNGLLIGKRATEWCISATIGTYMVDSYYFDRPDPEISIEIGKFYATRDGKKAYVFNQTSEGKLGVVVDNSMPYTVFKNGYMSDDSETDGDLVSLWDAPKKDDLNDKVVAMLKQGDTYDKIMKDLHVSSNRIAKIKRDNGIETREEKKVKGKKLLPMYKEFLSKGYTYIQIAKELGVSYSAVSNYIYNHKKELGR